MSRQAKSPTSTAGYIPGDNWVMCDICGYRFRASETQRQPHGIWRGLLVCDLDYDEYNPQHEDLRAVPEKIVPDVVNPEPESVVITYSGPLRFDFEFDGKFGSGGSNKVTADDL